jgi:UMF1 family MFS transporter
MDRKAVDAWCMYDWANSAFATTVMAALFPPFCRSLVLHAGLREATATALWGYTTAAALLIAAVVGPVMGAIADHTGGRKRWTAWFAALGIVATALMPLIRGSAWGLGTWLFILANLGFSASIVFYESLLPYVAPPGEIDRVSARGYAFGYVGGGLLLVLNAVWVLKPALFGLSGQRAAVGLSFLSVAVWWALFSLPFLRRVPEPPAVPGRVAPSRAAVAEGFARVGSTLRAIRRHRQLALFLAAFWIYNDGIGTIIKMATAYGDEIGITVGNMTLALILTQFVGVPFTFLFGAIARRTGAKIAVLWTLAAYVLIAAGGFFMRTAAHFYALAVLVGMVQGGAQALSRSLFGAMVPRHRTSEFFGFFSTSSKFAGIVGPVVFGIVSQAAGGSRWSILSLVVFFVVGGALLLRVDVDAGRREALAAEAEWSTGR